VSRKNQDQDQEEEESWVGEYRKEIHEKFSEISSAIHTNRRERARYYYYELRNRSIFQIIRDYIQSRRALTWKHTLKPRFEKKLIGKERKRRTKGGDILLGQKDIKQIFPLIFYYPEVGKHGITIEISPTDEEGIHIEKALRNKSDFIEITVKGDVQ